MRKDIKKAIMERKEMAQKCVDSILSSSKPERNTFDELFTQYLCGKFMLSPEELVTDQFYEICKLSAEKSSRLPQGMLDASELASKCSGATTAMNKKILFLMAVNREFGIEITAEESVAIETFTQLKQLVYQKLTG